MLWTKIFTIASIKRKNTPHINFIFVSEDTQLAYDALRVRASGYILKPITEEAVSEELNNLRFIGSNSKNRMTVQCFGKFEVYLNGKIMNFSRSLSKEALAYLIDNKGAACTVQEICDVLWENRPVSTSLKSQCRVIMSSLKKDLEAQGAEGVLVKGWNYWGIDADKISCDYYDYLRNRGKGKNSFQGEYMSQYSWAEMTSGRLYQMDRENKK